MTDRTRRLELAHALRTPLTSASLAAGLLESGVLGPLSRDQRDAVDGLVRDLARLRGLVEEGLDVERAGVHAGPFEPSPIAVTELLSRSVRPLLSQARERSVVVASSADAEGMVSADATKLGWALTTLVANAVRYARARVEITARRRTGWVAIAVHDDGPGIEPSMAARIFERGGGLGLYLVREVVEAHAGAISVRSGPGTTFTVTMPLLGAPSEERP